MLHGGKSCNNNVDYDVIATSYYPYWHGSLDNLESVLNTVRTTYKVDVMVAETSYAYTLEDSDGHSNTVREGNNDSGDNLVQPFTVRGQATAIRNVVDTVNKAGGIGVFYWEPAWITVGNTQDLTGDEYDSKVAANKALWEAKRLRMASSHAGEYDSKMPANGMEVLRSTMKQCSTRTAPDCITEAVETAGDRCCQYKCNC